MVTNAVITERGQDCRWDPEANGAYLLGLLLERLLSNVLAGCSYLLELVLLFHGRSWHISLHSHNNNNNNNKDTNAFQLMMS